MPILDYESLASWLKQKAEARIVSTTFPEILLWHSPLFQRGVCWLPSVFTSWDLWAFACSRGGLASLASPAVGLMNHERPSETREREEPARKVMDRAGSRLVSSFWCQRLHFGPFRNKRGGGRTKLGGGLLQPLLERKREILRIICCETFLVCTYPMLQVSEMDLINFHHLRTFLKNCHLLCVWSTGDPKPLSYGWAHLWWVHWPHSPNFLMKKLKTKESEGFAWCPTAGLQHKHIAILLFFRCSVFLNFKDQQSKKRKWEQGWDRAWGIEYRIANFFFEQVKTLRSHNYYLMSVLLIKERTVCVF